MKSAFDRASVVEVAFELTRRRGWPALSARAIAGKLGSSTMPIHSAIGSMEEVAREVRARAERPLLDFRRLRYTSDPAENKAVGCLVYAREEKNLFRFLFIDRPVEPTAVNEAKDGPDVRRNSSKATSSRASQTRRA